MSSRRVRLEPAAPPFGYAVLAVATFASSACDAGRGLSNDGGPDEYDHARFAPVALEGVALRTGDLLGLPARVEVVDGHLVLLDVASDRAVHVLDARDGRHVRSLGATGDGPGEFRGVWSIDAAPQTPGGFWIYDLSLRRLTQIRLDAAGSGPVLVEESSIHLRADVVVLDPLWVDTLLVTLGFFSGGRLGRFDGAGRFLGAVARVPGRDDSVALEVLQHAYQSRLVGDATRTRFAVATRHADLLEIFLADGTPVARAEPPFGFLPRYTVREGAGGPTLATGSDLRFGYVDLAANEERIYALFSGRTRRGFPGAASHAEYLHVYDWGATLWQVYRLDAPAVAIAVTADGAELYAVRHHPAPAVVRYRFPRDAP